MGVVRVGSEDGDGHEVGFARTVTTAWKLWGRGKGNYMSGGRGVG